MWQDLKYGGRMLAKNRGLTAIAVLTLALGIGANATVFTILKGIVLRPLPAVRAADQLVVVLTVSRGGERGPLNFPDYKDIRDRNQVLSALAGTFPVSFTLGAGDQAEHVWGEIVTGNLFQVLGVRPALGRLFTPDDDRVPGGHPVVVISHSLWQRKFGGDPAVIGKPLRVGTRTFTIVGITEPEYRGSIVGLSLQVFVPLMMQREVMTTLGDFVTSPARNNHWLLTVGRVKPGVSFEQARAAIGVIGNQIQSEYPEAGIGERALLVPLSQSPYGAQSV